MNIDNIGERTVKTPARAVRVNNNDNVAVVLNEIHAGEEVLLAAGWTAVARQNIPIGHKMSVNLVEAGQPVIKSGQVIGLARCLILPGDHVHVHNVNL